MRAFRGFIHWTWCFPQTFAGFLVFRWCKKHGETIIKQYKSVTLIETSAFSTDGVRGVSLGGYIFIRMNLTQTEIYLQALRHEYGHALQSYILGCLYLPIIGVISGLGNVPAFSWLYRRKKDRYFDRPVERWASRLGGVTVNLNDTIE